MATLRDALTSEHIADGTPLQMVRLADEIGRDEVLFDGVGPAFDPDLVLQAYDESMEGLHGALGEATGGNKGQIQKAIEAAQIEAEIAPLVRSSQDAIKEARANHELGHEDDEPEIPPNPDAAPQTPKETEPITTEFVQDPETGAPKKAKGK